MTWGYWVHGGVNVSATVTMTGTSVVEGVGCKFV